MRAQPILLLVVAFAIGACSFNTDGIEFPGDPDGSPDDPDASEIDGLVTVDGGPDATPPVDGLTDPDADECTTQCVDAIQLLDCEQGGAIVSCDLGCSESGGAHCRVLVPSNGATSTHLENVTSGLLVFDDEVATLNSDNGEIVIAGSTFRIGGEGVNASGVGFFILSSSLAVIAVSSLTMGEDSRLDISGTRALIILSEGDVAIEGVINLGGGCHEADTVHCAGPGGGAGSTGSGAGGCAPGGEGEGGTGGPEAGGGGGGLGEDGADGGDAELAGRAGGAGGDVSVSCPGASLVPLVGGSGGGAGGADGAKAIGGGGGGALQISSFTEITLRGGVNRAQIWAGGAGGGPGSTGNGGAGGGSGGAVLLEAPSIAFDFVAVTANGGGGGAGHGGGRGQYGQPSTDPALGGTASGNTNGGAGGARFAAAQEGQGPNDAAGGGGGGVGILRFNVPSSELSTIQSILSPQETRADPNAE